MGGTSPQGHQGIQQLDTLSSICVYRYRSYFEKGY